DGQMLSAGDALTVGSVNPHDLLKIKGVRDVQDYMTKEVQRVYRLQGVEINDKHIEVIVRQMLKKVRVEEKGDSEFLPGTSVDALDFEEVNEKLVEEGKRPAEGRQVMLGITKASLATNSFLSAASFQETTKVLTDAAIRGRIDPLIGLKENVILGKLIPAGTGMKKYRNIRLDTDNEILDNEEGFEDEFRTDLDGQNDIIPAETIDDTSADFEDEYSEEFDESDFFDAEFADEDFEYEELEEEKED
ncbi:MAG: DNA-directed RNA polymerase subunit beta', partial [Lachnospiraceae bacterium]|nr:DNA-directed RNA polymerase subunit beta' [Lachnospiraceae bacterium]